MKKQIMEAAVMTEVEMRVAAEAEAEAVEVIIVQQMTAAPARRNRSPERAAWCPMTEPRYFRLPNFL